MIGILKHFFNVSAMSLCLLKRLSQMLSPRWSVMKDVVMKDVVGVLKSMAGPYYLSPARNTIGRKLFALLDFGQMRSLMSVGFLWSPSVCSRGGEASLSTCPTLCQPVQTTCTESTINIISTSGDGMSTLSSLVTACSKVFHKVG